MADADQIVFVGTFWTNTDGLSLNEGDLVIRDVANIRGVKRTVVPNHPDVVGVCLNGAPPLGTVRVATVVGQRVRVNVATGTAVIVGDRLVSSIDAGLAGVDNTDGATGVFAVATDVKPGGSGSNVEVLIVALGGAGGGSGTGTTIHEQLINGYPGDDT